MENPQALFSFGKNASAALKLLDEYSDYDKINITIQILSGVNVPIIRQTIRYSERSFYYQPAKAEIGSILSTNSDSFSVLRISKRKLDFSSLCAAIKRARISNECCEIMVLWYNITIIVLI